MNIVKWVPRKGDYFVSRYGPVGKVVGVHVIPTTKGKRTNIVYIWPDPSPAQAYVHTVSLTRFRCQIKAKVFTPITVQKGKMLLALNPSNNYRTDQWLLDLRDQP